MWLWEEELSVKQMMIDSQLDRQTGTDLYLTEEHEYSSSEQHPRGMKHKLLCCKDISHVVHTIRLHIELPQPRAMDAYKFLDSPSRTKK